LNSNDLVKNKRKEVTSCGNAENNIIMDSLISAAINTLYLNTKTE